MTFTLERELRMRFGENSYQFFIACASVIFVLLSFSPVMANKTNEDTYILDEVLVEADEEEGSAAQGYRVDNVKTIGPFADQKLLDTPYSIFAMSEDMIENSITGNMADLFKKNPLITVTGGGAQALNNLTWIYTRGFSSSTTLYNGMAGVNQGGFPEEIESMEVLSGLSGFLYGTASVGGVLNLNSKRPTSEFMAKITGGNYGGSQYYGHIDMGGPIVGNKLNFRLNALYQDGETYIKDQNVTREMLTAAVDWHVTEDLLLQFDFAYKNFELEGRQNSFASIIYSGTEFPDHLDGSKLWGPKGTENNIKSYGGGVGAKYRLNDIFSFRTGYLHREDIREALNDAGTFIDKDHFTLYVMTYQWKSKVDSAYAYTDAKFNTFGVGHTLTFGANGTYNVGYTAPQRHYFYEIGRAHV